MSRKIRVDSVKCAFLSLFSGCFLIFALALLCADRPAGAMICLIFSVVYLLGAALNGALVRIDSSGISRCILWLPPQYYRWEQLAEIGVFGTKLFNLRNRNNVGTLYMYFSTGAMTEEQRFRMVLHWPPKQIYFSFKSSHLELVRYFWEKDIVGYNVGELVL